MALPVLQLTPLIIRCRASLDAVRTKPSPPPPQQPQLLMTRSTTAGPAPSLSCSLQCPHFDSCSGCTHDLNLHHPLIVDEASDFFKRFGVEDFSFDTCRLWGWRCRAKLAVRGSSISPLIGLYQEGTHDVVDIPECKAHHPSINSAVELVRQGMAELSIQPYNEDEGTGDLRYIQMAVTTHNTSLPSNKRYKNGKVQIALVWNSRNENSHSSVKLYDLSNFLWKKGGPRAATHLIHSVWANFQTSANNVIFGNRWRHLLGERDFWEHIGGIDISLDPSSFGQANIRAFDSLLRKLQKYVPYRASVADLYAGAGAIGLSLAVARRCRSVKCIEINKESKLSFEKTVARLASSVDCCISWHHADTSTEPLSWLVGAEVVIVDPPRKGLDQSLIYALQNISSLELKTKSLKSLISKEEKRPWVTRRAREAAVTVESTSTWEETETLPETLIYISCGWQSFKEDCKSLLSSKAWHLHKAHGFNFFPGTQSIEVLAVFKRGPGLGQKKRKKSIKKKNKPSFRTQPLDAVSE
uniref:Methyltransferase small domain-containing protein n=1 Tax=Kalanchoe fedtschenkoi TaxID=63787 RepID=A0A7N0UPM0_KALFE